jgi:hypothetical protein
MSDPIPPGRWRTGSHATRNLWIGGAHPEGVDVGRMDSPELAAYVVEAVNARLEHERLDAEVRRVLRADAPSVLGATAGEGPPLSAEMVRQAMDAAARRRMPWTMSVAVEARRERDEARAEVERLRAALREILGDGRVFVAERPDNGTAAWANAFRRIAREALDGTS